MKYADLDLKLIRDKAGLDFAHYTFKKGMCSCCYGPRDLPKIYWRDQKVLDTDDFTYILFKNADNGSGHVKAEDEIRDYTCVMWRFPWEKMDLVCEMLQEQVGQEYNVIKPEDEYTCILIRTR